MHLPPQVSETVISVGKLVDEPQVETVMTLPVPPKEYKTPLATMLESPHTLSLPASTLLEVIKGAFTIAVTAWEQESLGGGIAEAGVKITAA